MGSFQVARSEDVTMLTLPNLETASKSKTAKVLEGKDLDEAGPGSGSGPSPVHGGVKNLLDEGGAVQKAKEEAERTGADPRKINEEKLQAREEAALRGGQDPAAGGGVFDVIA